MILDINGSLEVTIYDKNDVEVSEELEQQIIKELNGGEIEGGNLFFGLESNRILIAHDELDLPNAEIKLKDSGGHGGHNGLRNIIDQLQGDKSFKRLRIGIGHPGKNKDVISYVLKKAPKLERQILLESLYDYLDIGERLLLEGWQKTVMNYHTNKEEADES